MPFTEKDKIFINNLFDLKGYNGKRNLERKPCLPVVAKVMGYWVGRPLFQQQQMLQHPHS